MIAIIFPRVGFTIPFIIKLVAVGYDFSGFNDGFMKPLIALFFRMGKDAFYCGIIRC